MGCGASLRGIRTSSHLSPELEDKLRTLHKNMDADHDGRVTKEEASKWFTGAFAKLSAIAMFNEVDTDQNGEMSEDEFVAFWKQVKRSGYTEKQIADELEQLEQGQAWVDWLDERATGGTKK
mmetsp:Transcript_16713/g.47815  ORF Transcript_16713/g.47815 Transcript_16713/m.47815 type:complete len:122 (+) Transcript_16713:143-508(+)